MILREKKPKRKREEKKTRSPNCLIFIFQNTGFVYISIAQTIGIRQLDICDKSLRKNCFQIFNQ